MTHKAYFNEEIREVVKQELSNAQKEIIIAIAWFNDNEIFNILVEKASSLHVDLLISNDPNNFENTNSLDFGLLIDKGGVVNRLVTEDVFMHNKFCLIDNHTVITGSYNWTYGAYFKNLENVIIVENDIKLYEKFKAEYNRIVDTYFTHLKEADEILLTLQNAIEDYRENIRRSRYIPQNIMERLRRGQGNFLTDGKENESHNTDYITQKRLSDLTDLDKESWWDNLPNQWKLFSAHKILNIGRQEIKPSADAIDYLIKTTKIDCSGYYNSVWNRDAKRNDITYYISSLIGLQNFTNLIELDCSNNNLDENSIFSLNEMTNIEKLFMQKNKLKSIPLNYPLPKLIELDISDNLFQSLDFFTNTPNVEVLYCHSNPLSGIQGVERAKRLRIIYIDKKVYELPFVNSKFKSLQFEQRDNDTETIIKLERVL